MIESKNIEFKEKLNRTVLKEIVAFGNSEGGVIYLGVKDNGNAVGLENIQLIQEQLSSMIRDNIKPSILNFIGIEIISIDDKEVIIINVQMGSGRPYYLSDKGMRPSGVYKRLANTSVPVSENDIREMIAQYHGLTYETTRSLNQDLTFNYALDQFNLRGMELRKSQMKSLGFVDESDLYTNLALLLSDQCPHIIKAAIFRDDSKRDFLHRQEFGGSLLKQMDDVYQFLQMQNHMTTTYDGLRRIDDYDYDPITLREGLINAIIHRDYSVGGSTFVNVYKSFCEFVSLGSLPKGIHEDDILAGVSKPRNEKLANVFYRLELIEAYGTGIAKILDAYKDSLRNPEIVITSGAFKLKLPKMVKTDNLLVKEEKAEYIATRQSVNTKNKDEVLKDILIAIEEKGYITRLMVQDRYGFGQTKSGMLLKELEGEERVKKIGKGKNIYYVINN